MTRKNFVSAIVFGVAVLGACKEKAPGPPPTSAIPTASATAAPKRLDIAVTEKGCEPDRLTVEKGKHESAGRWREVHGAHDVEPGTAHAWNHRLSVDRPDR